MNLQKTLWIAFFLHGVLSTGSIAVPVASEPDGRYCGHVLHHGAIVYSEIQLTYTEDGNLKGTVRYRDDHTITEGTITETKRDDAYTRTIHWSDKYGYGFAILSFNADFSAFEGLWGAEIETPSHTWTGKRCRDLTS